MANKNRGSDGKFTYIRELQPIQQKMIIKLIENGGNKTQACKDLNVPRSTLYEWLGNELFEEAYKRTCELMFKEAFPEALKMMINLTKTGDSRTRLKACEDILKLNGYLDTKLDISQNPSEICVTLTDMTE